MPPIIILWVKDLGRKDTIPRNLEYHNMNVDIFGDDLKIDYDIH